MYTYTDIIKMKVCISLTTEDIERLIGFDEVSKDDGTCSVIIERIKPHSFGCRNFNDRTYVSEEADVLYVRFMKEQEKFLAKLKDLHNRPPRE